MFHLLFGWSRIKQANKHKNSESFRPRRPDFLFSVFFDVQLFFLSTFFFHSLKLPLHFYSFFFKFFMSIKKTEKIHLTGKTNNRKNWFKISKTHSPSCHRKINPSPDLKVLWQKKELFLVSVKRYFFFFSCQPGCFEWPECLIEWMCVCVSYYIRSVNVKNIQKNYHTTVNETWICCVIYIYGL